MTVARDTNLRTLLDQRLPLTVRWHKTAKQPPVKVKELVIWEDTTQEEVKLLIRTGDTINIFATRIQVSVEGDVPNGVFNVKDFGAVGNGSTNDTGYIQLAIDACASIGGGTVYCPTGTYLITNLVIGASNVTLQGASVGHAGRAGLTPSSATTLLKTDAVGYALTMGSGSVVQGIVLKEIAIHCSAGSAVKLNTNATFSQLNNVQLRGAGNISTTPTTATYGIDQLNFAFGASIRSCHIQGFDVGLWCKGNADAQTEVHGCWVEYNNVGIRCGDTAGGTILSAAWIHHSTVENSATYNIEIQNAKELYLHHLYLEVSVDGPGGDGSYIWSTATIPLAIGLGADVPENIHVRDCRFQGTYTAARAVDLSNVQGLIFEGCRFLNFTETQFIRNNATFVENIYFGNCPGFGPTNISAIDGVETITTRNTTLPDGHAIYGTLGVGTGAPTTAQLAARSNSIDDHAAAFQRFSSGQVADIVSIETATGTKLIGVNNQGYLTPGAANTYDLGEVALPFRVVYAATLQSDTVETDTIDEKTTDAGVTIETVALKDGNIRSPGNLGIGNSAAATTPGTVTKKLEIFDESGSSLGFIPIYDAIT